MRSNAEHLRVQRDERWLKRHGFLIVQPNPFVDEFGIEAVAQGDVGDGGAGLGALLNDLSFEGFAVGTALRDHGKSA
ncbi:MULTISPECIES: hypothetical protein [Pseudomonas]|jgi:hypothetical protein|uniref:hypothetical protein n=1 Tax=Pseudomonas TaxID=286 RepID=UPI000CD4356C|nr:hypothetical protein [Pseudomonas putida]POF97762.1 hypothetical protein BGP81_14015 [Pseudomonas putida]GJB81337.1 hypothetical protein KAM380_058020 [Aeromonas caviae]